MVNAAVYSARNEGKAHCFNLIAERFGSDCNYVAIGIFFAHCSHTVDCIASFMLNALWLKDMFQLWLHLPVSVC